MKTIKVKNIDQRDWWCQSFNVLVPLEIQGRIGTLLEAAKPPTKYRGSQNAQVMVDGKVYGIPGWAVGEP